MSLNSWKDEFLSEEYPSDPLKALDHSIKKWEGLSEENLRKHNLFQRGSAIEERADSHSIEHIGASNCALCTHFMFDGISECVNCPIYMITHKDCSREYEHFVYHANHQPMLDLLLAVRAKWAAKMAVKNGPLGLAGTVNQGSERPESRPAGERSPEGLPGGDGAV